MQKDQIKEHLKNEFDFDEYQVGLRVINERLEYPIPIESHDVNANAQKHHAKFEQEVQLNERRARKNRYVNQ